MSVYLDTSCLLKLLFDEPETERTMELVTGESRVVVSTLARLEAVIQLQARATGGLMSPRSATRLLGRMDALLRRKPYELVATPVTTFEAAEDQVLPLGRSTYCRTLDRLHLGAMARAASAVGFTVTMPR